MTGEREARSLGWAPCGSGRHHLFLNDPSGQPGGYSALKDAKLRRDALGTLAEWAVKVMK